MKFPAPVWVFTYFSDTGDASLRVLMPAAYCDRPAAPAIPGWTEDAGRRTWRSDEYYIDHPAGSTDYAATNATMDAEAQARREAA